MNDEIQALEAERDRLMNQHTELVDLHTKLSNEWRAMSKWRWIERDKLLAEIFRTYDKACKLHHRIRSLHIDIQIAYLKIK